MKACQVCVGAVIPDHPPLPNYPSLGFSRGRQVEELMPVIVVIIIAVAWIAILTPNVMRRRSRQGNGINSISHFHRQLRVLEHSAPEPLVAPAYRLCSGGAGEGSDEYHSEEPGAPTLTVVGADRLPRPALAFLGRDGDYHGDRGPAAAGVRRPAEAGSPPPGRAVSVPALDRTPRHRVRRRRRDTLGVLAGVFVVTVLLGFLPGASAAWVVSAVSGVALGAYVALLVRLQRLAEERGRKLHYLQDRARFPSGGRVADEMDMFSERFAHPSHQVWATR